MKAFAISLLLVLVVFTWGVDGQVVIISTFNASNWTPFDCRRSFQSCFNQGTCSSVNGICNCGANRGRYDCSINLAQYSVVNFNCGIPCDAGRGQCYRNNLNGQFICHCNPTFAGPSCQRERGFLECHTNQTMTVYAYPQRPTNVFTGMLGAVSPNTLDLLATGGCRYNTQNTAVWDGTRFRVSLNTAAINNVCSGAREVRTVNGVQQVCMHTRLQYNSVFQTNFDENYIFCCTQNTVVPDGTGIVGNSAGSANVAQVTSTVNILLSRMLFFPSGQLIPASTILRIGQVISFEVRFNEAGAQYNDLRLVTCTANPGNIPLIVNRCPVQRSMVADLRIPSTGERRVVMDLWTWRPVDSNQITVSCTALACVGTCGTVTACAGTSIQGYGRKRRQAEEPEGKFEYDNATQSFRVEISLPEESCPVQEPCADINTVFIPVAVVFGALLILALGFALFLWQKFRNQERSIATKEPQAYYNKAMNHN